MKSFATSLASIAAISFAAEVSVEHPPADFNQAVHDFDFCENIIVQSDYEDYINEAANILIALEAFRLEINRLTEDVEGLEYCISHNDYDINDNDHEISSNDDDVSSNDEEIKRQQYRTKSLQKSCRRCESDLTEDR